MFKYDIHIGYVYEDMSKVFKRRAMEAIAYNKIFRILELVRTVRVLELLGMGAASTVTGRRLSQPRCTAS